MRQRVMIAMALSCDPKLLIADEPTTALDVTIQAQILEIVRELRHRLGMGIIWITHDLGLVAGIADRVMVMYAGQVVEHGPVAEIFADPQHPYTRALLGTVPSVAGPRARRLRTIEGQPPVLMADPDSCPFAPRCGHVFDRCRAREPAADPGRATGTTSPAGGTRRPGGRAMASEAAPLLRVVGAEDALPGLRRASSGGRSATVKAVDDVSFDIAAGETLGLVGESGCGKSTTGRAILRLYEPTGGAIELEGRDIARLEGGALRALRPKMQMIFQDPQASLNPRMTVGSIIAEPLDEHARLDRAERRARVMELMDAVGPQPPLRQPLPARVLRRPAPAHRHRPGAGARTRSSSSATSRSPRSTSRSRRRWSTCSRICRRSSG